MKDSTIQVICPVCEEQYQAAVEHEGFTLRCWKCSSILRIERTASELKQAPRPVGATRSTGNARPNGAGQALPQAPSGLKPQQGGGGGLVWIVLPILVAAGIYASVDRPSKGDPRTTQMTNGAPSSASPYRPAARSRVASRENPVIYRTLAGTDNLAIWDFGDYIEQRFGYGIPPIRVPQGGPGDDQWKAMPPTQRRAICGSATNSADSLAREARGMESSTMASSMRGMAMGMVSYCMQEDVWQMYLSLAR